MTQLAQHLTAFLREHLPRERAQAFTLAMPMPIASSCW